MNELQEPVLVLTASSNSLVKLEGVGRIFLYCVQRKSLDIFEHVGSGSCPLSIVCCKRLIHELGDQDCILHVKLFDAIHEAAHDRTIV